MKLVKLGMICGALLVAACGGDDGIQGPQGEPGPAGPAGSSGASGGAGAGVESINGITPTRSFPGRLVTVSISGDNTNWTDATTVTVDDPAVTVNNVSVASSTSLVVDIQIGEAAPIGEKTFTIDGKAHKGFRVVHSAQATLTGTQAQGSVLFLDAVNNDPENLFSTSEGGLGLTGLGAGTTALLGAVEAQYAQFIVLLDGNASTAATTIALEGASGATFSSEAELAVQARQPEALASGTVTLGPVESKLYSYSVAGAGTRGSLFSFALENAGPSYAMYDLGPSASWDGVDLEAPVSGAFAWVEAGQTASSSLTLVNLGASAPATMTVFQAPIEVDEVEPNDTNAAATTVADITKVLYGEFSATEDVDTFKVTLAESKVLRARTYGLKIGEYDSIFGAVPGAADTVITIKSSVGDTIIESDDADFNEDVKTPTALEPGDYYVTVTASSFAEVEEARNNYALQLTLE